MSRIATDAAFIDTDRWKAGSNDLGDSNVIVEYDAHWCGAMWALNKLRKNGFALAYARHGRGLIIYDGFDRDQFTSPVYSTLITRELKQPFDGDHLPCSQPVGAFIITTTAAQRSRPMAASSKAAPAGSASIGRERQALRSSSKRGVSASGTALRTPERGGASYALSHALRRLRASRVSTPSRFAR